MSRQHIVHKILEPGLPGDGFTAPEAATVRNDLSSAQTAIARVDPGTTGTTRQVLRYANGGPQWKDAPTFFGRDYLTGSPVENASVGLGALIAAAHGPNDAGVPGAHIVLEPGEYRLTQTLDLTRFSGIISGAGWGNSPAYPLAPGHATVLRWDGPADEPMIRINDSTGITIENLRLEGNTSAPPSYGIECIAYGGEGIGTNQRSTFRNLHIGEWWWSSVGTGVRGKVKRGIGFTGDNSNNDKFLIDMVRVNAPLEYGLYVANSQSVGGHARDFYVSYAGIAGVSTAASMLLTNAAFQTNAVDIQTTAAGAVVRIVGGWSENAQRFANLYHTGHFTASDMYIQTDDIITTANADPSNPAKGILINAFPSERQYIGLFNIRFDGMTNPARARIELGPRSPDILGNFVFETRGCNGLHPDQIVLPSGASMWSTNPMSQGTIQFESRADGKAYAFRNELTHSSGRGRQAINRLAWDMPLSTSRLQTVINGVLSIRQGPAPTSGERGDIYVDQGTGDIMYCKFAGTPGTWQKLNP